MGSLGAAISGSVESLCLPCRRLMNSKSPRPLGGTYEDNCSSIQQPHFQCVFKVRMQHLRRHCAVLQLSSMESRPPDADNLSRGNIGAVEELQALFPQPSLLQFMYADLGDHRHVNEFFSQNAIDAVMHFATVAYVSEVWLNHYGTFAIL